MSQLINNIANINRGILENRLVVFEKYSRALLQVLDTLWSSRLIIGYSVKKNIICVVLKYTNLGLPIIKKVQTISKPGFYRSRTKNIACNKYLLLTNSKGYFLKKKLEVVASGQALFQIIV
jgi:ribosomal protein S8